MGIRRKLKVCATERRTAELTLMGAVRNRTLCVNLRKELVCPRAMNCASDIQRKEARELRDYERRYSRPLRYLRC